MAKLFSPVSLGPLTVKNRLWASPMCQYSVETRDGRAGPWHQAHYGAMAAGGAGLVVVEATAVAPEGRITPWDLGLWDDSQIDALAPVAAFIEAQGAVPAIQLGHAGRKASTQKMWEGDAYVPPEQGGYQAVAPSAIPFADLPTPRELTAEEVAGVARAFGEAAARARQAGFRAVEIHAAHGYLLHQFLSPLSNHREDEYGGSGWNRGQLIVDVVRAVRDGIGPDAALMMRVSATDWVEGGWDVDDTSQLVGRLAQYAGIDHLDVSTGGLVPDARIPVGPAYQAPFAAQIAQETGIQVNSVGIIDTPEMAERLVTEGGLDAVMLGRPFLRDPHTPIKWAVELGEDAAAWTPPQYARAAWTRYYARPA
ncbi:MAG: NADH:flavin oxidoreductase/NADH oxidase [Bifidobacteriaceae bacterium]|jgi:2,4-dienoyl-CoA reductase-like NADH-dependent reductase (Old Yellow Enzyme family)|nr:NADH:flavin oxidoreductase/NADH oxidase [Bifidobacteriaceae bacterium]